MKLLNKEKGNKKKHVQMQIFDVEVMWHKNWSSNTNDNNNNDNNANTDNKNKNIDNGNIIFL